MKRQTLVAVIFLFLYLVDELSCNKDIDDDDKNGKGKRTVKDMLKRTKRKGQCHSYGETASNDYCVCAKRMPDGRCACEDHKGTKYNIGQWFVYQAHYPNRTPPDASYACLCIETEDKGTGRKKEASCTFDCVDESGNKYKSGTKYFLQGTYGKHACTCNGGIANCAKEETVIIQKPTPRPRPTMPIGPPPLPWQEMR